MILKPKGVRDMTSVKIINGVDLERLSKAVGEEKTDPSKALIRFRADTKWLMEARSSTRIKEFVLEADEPEALLGSGKAPNAVEIVLAALGASLSVGFAYSAAAWGIDLKSLEFRIEGDLDLRGFLGVSDKVRPGYQNITVACKLKSSASKKRIQELFEYVRRTSPVTDIVRNPVPVKMKLED
jgi:uncharacterized OsmC-like protein